MEIALGVILLANPSEGTSQARSASEGSTGTVERMHLKRRIPAFRDLNRE
jgi:hypothetical protein